MPAGSASDRTDDVPRRPAVRHVSGKRQRPARQGSVRRTSDVDQPLARASCWHRVSCWHHPCQREAPATGPAEVGLEEHSTSINHSLALRAGIAVRAGTALRAGTAVRAGTTRGSHAPTPDWLSRSPSLRSITDACPHTTARPADECHRRRRHPPRNARRWRTQTAG